MINHERELLEKAIALRDENRALKAVIKQVANEAKMTAVFPTTVEQALSGAIDITLQKETLLKLLEVGGDDVRFGRSRTAESRTGTKKTTSQTKNAVGEQQ